MKKELLCILTSLSLVSCVTVKKYQSLQKQNKLLEQEKKSFQYKIEEQKLDIEKLTKKNKTFEKQLEIVLAPIREKGQTIVSFKQSPDKLHYYVLLGKNKADCYGAGYAPNCTIKIYDRENRFLVREDNFSPDGWKDNQSLNLGKDYKEKQIVYDIYKKKNPFLIQKKYNSSKTYYYKLYSNFYESGRNCTEQYYTGKDEQPCNFKIYSTKTYKYIFDKNMIADWYDDHTIIREFDTDEAGYDANYSALINIHSGEELASFEQFQSESDACFKGIKNCERRITVVLDNANFRLSLGYVEKQGVSAMVLVKEAAYFREDEGDNKKVTIRKQLSQPGFEVLKNNILTGNKICFKNSGKTYCVGKEKLFYEHTSK
ncbi:MAG: hypothetical protein AAF518_25480 [Spirochaetota bacterium]